jgi:mRNA interferase RelE/StbE
LIVKFSKNFSKDLEKVKDSNIKNDIIETIIVLENAENLTSISNIKKMKGHSEAYRLRIGKFRIGFYFDGETIELGRFAKRDDIYKLFP